MQYDGLAWATALCAVIITLVALRILLSGQWFLAWLRGTCGLVFAVVAGLIGLIAYDMLSYSALPDQHPIATISFNAVQGESTYEVTIDDQGGERKATLDGNLWQLDVRLLEWKGLAAMIGLEPGYRLEKLTGRFFAIEQQQRARHAHVTLANSLYGVDLWRWLRLGQHDLWVFDAQAARVDYLPIADGAVYSIALTPTGLLAQPVNQAAQQALKRWQ